jgi:ABC-type molybdate transport system ATPase subunit
MSVEGPSGLGKTRLLRAIAQLDKPVGGSMSIIEVRVCFALLCCVLSYCILLYVFDGLILFPLFLNLLITALTRTLTSIQSRTNLILISY